MAKQKKSDDILQRSQDRADMIAQLMDQFENMVEQYSSVLTEHMIETFAHQLNVEGGNVLTDEENLRRVTLIDKAWSKFHDTEGLKIISNFLTDMESINDENLNYYRTLSDANIKPGDIKNVINARLGLDSYGRAINGGYVKGLMDDTSVRDEIKKLAYQKIISGTGFNDLTKSLKTHIEGGEGETGKFKSYYRNFAFDTYTTVDRMNAALYAEKLNLKYFIFQGTRRKQSRHFCLKRKGQVFTTEEAKEWVDLIGKHITIEVNGKSKKVPIGPIVDDKATYNPLTDLGGYGCVDVVSYISEQIAFQLRPDLKTRISVSEDYKEVHEGANKAKVYVHKEADENDLKYNIEKAQIVADNGESLKIRMHVNAKGVSNPELQTASGKLSDFKEPEKGSKIKTAITSRLKSSNNQGAEVPILILSKANYDKLEVIRALNGSIRSGINKGISEVWILIGREMVKISREEIIRKSYYNKLP